MKKMRESKMMEGHFFHLHKIGEKVAGKSLKMAGCP